MGLGFYHQRPALRCSPGGSKVFTLLVQLLRKLVHAYSVSIQLVNRDCGHLNLIVEGGCLPLINKLGSTVSEETTLGLIIRDILDVTKHFNFVSFSFVK